MTRKIALVVAILIIGVTSVVLMGGETNGYLWWGNHAPIYIGSDSEFTPANGVVSGSGTQSDPYVISGWSISAANADYGIYIDHTTRYFTIKNCVIERARNAGIYLNSVKNGRIEGCELTLNGIGIHLLNADGVTITDNALADNRYGVVADADARNNVIFDNSFIKNGVSARDITRKNAWYRDKTGNYWSDYTGADKNGDGIGDQPYRILFDPYPLMTPPVSVVHFTPAHGPATSLPRSPQGYIVVNSSVPIALSAHDPGSGVAKILYAINAGKWQVYSGPFSLTGDDGVYKVAYYAVDHLGNAEPVHTLTFVLDNHPPATAISFGTPSYADQTGQWVTSHTPITLTLTAHSTYGTTHTYYAIDSGSWQPYTGPFHLRGADGPHTISYYSRNASGIAESAKTVTVYKDDTPPATVGRRSVMTPHKPQSQSSAVTPATTVTPPPKTTTTVQTPPEKSEK